MSFLPCLILFRPLNSLRAIGNGSTRTQDTLKPPRADRLLTKGLLLRIHGHPANQHDLVFIDGRQRLRWVEGL